jgi:hypothetical protein
MRPRAVQSASSIFESDIFTTKSIWNLYDEAIISSIERPVEQRRIADEFECTLVAESQGQANFIYIFIYLVEVVGFGRLRGMAFAILFLPLLINRLVAFEMHPA